MGVINFYFQAPSVDVAQKTDPTVLDAMLPNVETKLAEPIVVLGMLIALITKTDWHVDLSGAVDVSPLPVSPSAENGAHKLGPEESLWGKEQWLYEISDRTRDILAEIDPNIHADLALQWAEIEELRWIPKHERDFVAPMILDFRALAQDARHKGHHLYCFTML